MHAVPSRRAAVPSRIAAAPQGVLVHVEGLPAAHAAHGFGGHFLRHLAGDRVVAAGNDRRRPLHDRRVALVAELKREGETDRQTETDRETKGWIAREKE